MNAAGEGGGCVVSSGSPSRSSSRPSSSYTRGCCQDGATISSPMWTRKCSQGSNAAVHEVCTRPPFTEGWKTASNTWSRESMITQKLSALTAKKLSEPFANVIRKSPYAQNFMRTMLQSLATQIRRVLISIIEKRNLEHVTDSIALFISLFLLGIFACYVCF